MKTTAFILSLLLCLPNAVFGGVPSEEMELLRLFYKDEELVVESATRGLRHITEVAENMTVITAHEIEMMNAHTLADVLNAVPGVQVFVSGGPGSQATLYVQGSEQRHVAVFIDGVNFGNITSNVVDAGMLPVQNIHKIEIIKGPASSAWGSSLGGIINIFTKSGKEQGRNGGTLASSFGEKGTAFLSADAYGKKDKAAYYFSAGSVMTDGLRPRNHTKNNNVYLKTNYDLTGKTGLAFTLGINWGDRGITEWKDMDRYYEDNFETLLSTLTLKSDLSDTVKAEVSVRTSRLIDVQKTKRISTGSDIQVNNPDDRGFGGSAKLSYKKDMHNMVVGTDYDRRNLKSGTIAGGEKGIRKAALYANDTVTLGDFSITPGIRHDDTDTNGGYTSPSIGATYKSAKDTVFRVYTSNGFNTPPVYYTYGDNVRFVSNISLKPETVRSYQAGMETAALKHVWLKASVFRHDIKDVITTQRVTATTYTYVNKNRQRRQGFETELKTAPVNNTSVFAGFIMSDARDIGSDTTVRNIPQYALDAGIQHDDGKGLKALFKGRYVWWNADKSYNGKYDATVFDANMAKTIYSRKEATLEAFCAIRNIFNTSQYLMGIYKNPARFAELGMRYKF